MSYLMEVTPGNVTWDSLSPIVEAIGNQISISSVVGVLAAVAGLAIGFVFLWWAARKGSKALIKAFKTGKFGF